MWENGRTTSLVLSRSPQAHFTEFWQRWVGMKIIFEAKAIYLEGKYTHVWLCFNSFSIYTFKKDFFNKFENNELWIMHIYSIKWHF